MVKGIHQGARGRPLAEVESDGSENKEMGTL